MKAGILKMNTIISKIDINNIDKNEIKKQSKLLSEGKTVIATAGIPQAINPALSP